MERLEIDTGDRRSGNIEMTGDVESIIGSNDAVAKVVGLKFDNREATGPIDIEAIKALRELFAPLRVKDATALIREMRDESDH